MRGGGGVLEAWAHNESYGCLTGRGEASGRTQAIYTHALPVPSCLTCNKRENRKGRRLSDKIYTSTGQVALGLDVGGESDLTGTSVGGLCRGISSPSPRRQEACRAGEASPADGGFPSSFLDGGRTDGRGYRAHPSVSARYVIRTYTRSKVLLSRRRFIPLPFSSEANTESTCSWLVTRTVVSLIIGV